MHQQGIVHRDLKLENVVYESKKPDSDIFIIDYGLSKVGAGAKYHLCYSGVLNLVPPRRRGNFFCELFKLSV